MNRALNIGILEGDDIGLEVVPETIKVKVFKVEGEINTDDFSPAGDAWSRPDIPLHALAMGKTRFKGGLDTIAQFRAAIAGQLFGLSLGLGFASQYDIHAGESAGTIRSIISTIAGPVSSAPGPIAPPS